MSGKFLFFHLIIAEDFCFMMIITLPSKFIKPYKQGELTHKLNVI